MDIEVPPMIRLLAADLYAARRKGNRLDLDLALNLHLDADSAVPIPSSWAKAWWRVNRDPTTEEVLGPQTIHECLKTHANHELAIQETRKRDDAAADPAGMMDPDRQLVSRPDVPLDLLSRDSIPMLPTMTPACPSCLPNRDAALMAFTNDQKHVRHFKAARDAFRERRDAAARRAAGFLRLHEAALAKDLEEGDGNELQSLTSTLNLNDIRALLQIGPAVPGGGPTGSPIEDDSKSDGSLDQYLVDTPEIDSDSPDNIHANPPATLAHGDAHHPISIPSRSPSHISLSSDSVGPATTTLAVNSNSDSDDIVGPNDILGTMESDSSDSDVMSLAPEGTNYIPRD